MAQGPIQPGKGPKSPPTPATSLPSTCSMEWLRGVHAWTGTPPPLPRAALLSTPPEVGAALPTPPCSHSLPSLAPPSLGARPAARAVAMAAVEAPAAAFSLLRTSSLSASAVSSFASISYISCSRSPSESVAVVAGVPPPPSVCVRGRTATDHLWPSRGHLRVRLIALMFPHPSIAADEAPTGRNRKLRRVSPVLFATRDLGLKFIKRQGSKCEVMTHVNSTCRDLSVVVCFADNLRVSVQICFSFI